MTAPPSGAEVLAEYVLHLDRGRLVVAEVLRLHDGSTRLRLSRGGEAAAVLSVENIGALRVVLAQCLEVMCGAEGRRAA